MTNLRRSLVQKEGLLGTFTVVEKSSSVVIFNVVLPGKATIKQLLFCLLLHFVDAHNLYFLCADYDYFDVAKYGIDFIYLSFLR